MSRLLEILTEETIDAILAEALEILQKVGIFVENEKALGLLKEAGAEIKENRVFIADNLVWSALKTVPSAVHLYDRLGNIKVTLEDDNVHFVTGSSAVYFLDSGGNIRKPVTEDYINLTKLTDFLPNLSCQSTAMIPADVSDKIADRYRLYLSLRHSSKPIITGVFTKEGFWPMREMLLAIRGSEENLRQKPLAIFDVCPSPPLKWSDLTCQCLCDCAQNNIPVQIISVPLAGATAPVTLYGAIVQHTAENLSGIVISQLANQGSPVIYGGSPAIFDMRRGSPALGAIETMMIDAAISQIGKSLGLPTHAYTGLSDSKGLDGQMGLEAGIGAILAALSGINMIAGAGMLAVENCQSLEKLMIDNEICGMALHLIRGIGQREKGETLSILQDCLAGGGFLRHTSTQRLFRQEQYIPRLFIDRLDIRGWTDRKEPKTFKERVKEEVEKALKEHISAPLDDVVQKELDKIWEKIKKSAI